MKPGKLFLPGFSSVSADIQFRNFPAAREAFADFVAQKTGTRWITASIPQEDTLLYKKKGVRYVTAEPWAIANGYRIGRVPNDKKPVDTIFRDLQGRPVSNHGVYATCSRPCRLPVRWVLGLEPVHRAGLLAHH